MNKAVVQVLNEHLSPLKGEMPEGQRGFKGGVLAVRQACCGWFYPSFVVG